MKHRVILPAVFFLSAIFSCNASFAQEIPATASIHRLDYVHFDAVKQTVEWGVSEGSLNDDGAFVPSSDTAPAIYSIKFGSGVMSHDGEEGRLSRNDTVLASQVFAALSQMVRVYTDEWGESFEPSTDPGIQNSQGDDSDDDNTTALRSIALHCRIAPGFGSASAASAKAPAAGTSSQGRGRTCAGGVSHELRRTSAAARKNNPSSLLEC